MTSPEPVEVGASTCRVPPAALMQSSTVTVVTTVIVLVNRRKHLTVVECQTVPGVTRVTLYMESVLVIWATQPEVVIEGVVVTGSFVGYRVTWFDGIRHLNSESTFHLRRDRNVLIRLQTSRDRK